MSDPVRICLVGATGMVGNRLMERLVGRSDFRLTAIARREVKLPRGARMEMILADPAAWGGIVAELRPQVVVCALGTTWKKSGEDEAAFRSVDHDLVLAVAKAAKAAGVRQFIHVSSVGADSGSKRVYLRVKGEVEEDLARLRFNRLDVLRPGLLRGKRAGDRRPLERAAVLASPLADALLLGRFRAFRSISPDQLCDAILGLAREKAGGRFVHEHDGLLRAGRRAGG